MSCHRHISVFHTHKTTTPVDHAQYYRYQPLTLKPQSGVFCADQPIPLDFDDPGDPRTLGFRAR